MLPFIILTALALPAFGAREFINEPDTGFEPFVEAAGDSTLMPLNETFSLADFDRAARNYMTARNYTYYRNGVAGEWSYRNNLEHFSRIRFRPRALINAANISDSLTTSILGYDYSMPFFIAPAARAEYCNPLAEQGLVRGAQAEGILYIPSSSAYLERDEISAAARSNSKWPGMFQQFYYGEPEEQVLADIESYKAEGRQAIILTVDSPADAPRTRASRYGVGSADTAFSTLDWDSYISLKEKSSLPIIPKGVASVEDAKRFVELGAPAIYLSNHGGRQLDFSPGPLEIALEIHREAPEIFEQVDVWADGGVRYGTDILKLLALGVKAVGLARPFMYANCYGEAGVRRAIQLLRNETIWDAANLGLSDLKQIGPQYLKIDEYNHWHP